MTIWASQSSVSVGCQSDIFTFKEDLRLPMKLSHSKCWRQVKDYNFQVPNFFRFVLFILLLVDCYLPEENDQLCLIYVVIMWEPLPTLVIDNDIQLFRVEPVVTYWAQNLQNSTNICFYVGLNQVSGWARSRQWHNGDWKVVKWLSSAEDWQL